jgi:hypothetical protein
MKAESQDHIAGDCCDPLLEVGQRMAVASRGARCKCRSRTLDVTPSRPATSSSPDKPENDGSENSRSIPTMPRTTRQVQTPPVSDSFTGDSRLRRQFRCIGEPIRRPSCSPLARIEALDRLRAPRMTLPTAISMSRGPAPVARWLWSSAAASPPAPATNNFPRRSRLLAPVR